jgi:hypothetical protein
MDLYVARDVGPTGQIACVVLGARLEPGGDRWHVAKLPDLGVGPNRNTIVPNCQTHWFFEGTKVGIEDTIRCANNYKLARLIGRHQQRTFELIENLRKIGRVKACERTLAVVLARYAFIRFRTASAHKVISTDPQPENGSQTKAPTRAVTLVIDEPLKKLANAGVEHEPHVHTYLVKQLESLHQPM